MTTITRYTSTYDTISHILCDGNSFLWIAHEADDDGVCHLKKVYASDLNQEVYDLSITANAIDGLYIYSNYIYVLFDSATTLLAKSYRVTSPITTYVEFERPAGITQESVDIMVSSYDGYVYILLAEESGVNSKIVKFDTDGYYDETIDIDASGIITESPSSFTMDDYGNIWIVTNTSPTKLVRVWYEDSVWDTLSFEIDG